MSLINKMLQDLDARGGAGGQPGLGAVRPVSVADRRVAAKTVLIGALLAGACAAAVAWRMMPRPAAPPVPVAAAVAPAPALPASAEPKVALAKAEPATAVAAVPEMAPVAAESPAPAAAPAASPVDAAPVAAPARAADPETGTAPSSTAADKVPAQDGQPVDKAPAHASVPKTLAAFAPAKEDREERVTSAAATKRAATTLDWRRVVSTAPATSGGRELSTQQRAENQYRRALDSLQEGRATQAMGELQQTLGIEPRHQGARETLIRLLLENNRHDEATRQLQLGLEADVRQPAMAMMLARLQIEKGGPAADMLMRTLPAAATDPDYLAFLAAILQREQRYKESSEFYQSALRLAPQNGVWWMGLGISLQEEGRAEQAREAFLRAKASGKLTSELLAFIDRKLQQSVP